MTNKTQKKKVTTKRNSSVNNKIQKKKTNVKNNSIANKRKSKKKSNSFMDKIMETKIIKKSRLKKEDIPILFVLLLIVITILLER